MKLLINKSTKMADSNVQEFEINGEENEYGYESVTDGSELTEHESVKSESQYSDEQKEHGSDSSDDIYSSIARYSDNGTIPHDILNFFYSYAYDCRRYFNLCVADANTVVFASGNLIHFFDVSENKISFKRGSTRYGIGHISKNLVFGHIAIGENGRNPQIRIYQWPSMRSVTSLRGGTTERYLYLIYSPDGLLLVSQGGEPDYFITIWKWQESKILLQCKSHSQTVYNVSFSKHIPEHLVSSGSGHIKFWKMSKTFTGLKLKGKIGRFGKTEISDIIAIYPMPNEMVISGCEWGNILLWDEDLIKLEICQKNRLTAHTKYITRFEYVNGELLSVGTDGWIRFWFYETIDHADVSDTDRFLEIHPIYEFHVTDGRGEDARDSAMLMCIQKQEPDDLEKSIYYAQDGNGGLWLLDLCTSDKPQIWQKILTCHAGRILDMDVADWGPFVVTLDENGHLHIYNYIDKKLIIVHKFYDYGSQVVWFPCKIDKTGSTLICAFGSGIVRLITVDVQTANTQDNIKQNYVRLLHALKPHTASITTMTLNPSNSLLVTGSEDSTIFAFNVQSTDIYPKIVPVGYIRVPSPVSCLTWNPWNETTLLIGCLRGDCVEVELPIASRSKLITTYELTDCNFAMFKFQSVKSEIQREAIQLKREQEKAERLAKKKEELEQLIAENPQIIIDEESFFTDDHEELPLPEIHIPEPPSTILVVQYVNNNTIWVLMSDFDAGFIYEYPNPLSKLLKGRKPIRSILIEGADSMTVHTCLFYKDRKYLFLGLQHGEIYVSKIKWDDSIDLSDYWILPIHDYYNGIISKMSLSYNREILFTCGHDGNLFAFEVNDDEPSESINIPNVASPLPLPPNAEDIENIHYPSLEEMVTQTEQNRIMKAAQKKKNETLQTIRNLSEEYVKIMKRNQNLLVSQQISAFELDHRIKEDIEEQLKTQMSLLLEKLAFDAEKSKLSLLKLYDCFVEPITCLPFAVRSVMIPDKIVYSLREQKFDIDAIFRKLTTLKCIEQGSKEVESQKKLKDVAVLGKSANSDGTTTQETKEAVEEEEIQYQVESSENFDKMSLGLKTSINQLLSKYKNRKEQLIEREKKWKDLHAKKPNLSNSYAKDIDFMETTRKNIGEYNLKLSATSNLMKRKQDAILLKYEQILDCRHKLHTLRENFNERLRMVRTKKQNLQKYVSEMTELLKNIHREIPAQNVKFLPEAPIIDLDMEFPEHNLEPEKYISMSEKVKQVKWRRQSIVTSQSFHPSDLEYEALLLHQKFDNKSEIEITASSISSSKDVLKDQIVQRDLLKSLNANDLVPTAWEREMKHSRMIRKLYEQDCILRRVEAYYEEIENELHQLEEDRLDVIYESTYINLFLLTLYEEFIILRKCEETENSLEEKVKQRSEECAALKSKIKATHNNIAIKEEEIRKIHVKIKDLVSRYAVMISENKFHDFLLKICKKKYTPEKKRDGSVDSITRSSEISSDEIESTDDSEANETFLDENVCPPECDKELYEMAFTIREKRYAFEQHIKEEEKEIEVLSKESEIDSKRLKMQENNLKKHEKELEAFLLEKQKSLNNIDVTVVLKFHQLQHFLDIEENAEIGNCVIFDKKKLSNLYKRVEELQQETIELEEKRKTNETHLRRLKRDSKYMEIENTKLEQEIKEEMIKKFGQKVSLLTLYETVLQRMIYDAKAGEQEAVNEYYEKIKLLKRTCDEEQQTLQELIQANTQKLSLLTILEKEKSKLKKLLEKPPTSDVKKVHQDVIHKTDIEKLESILRNQMQEKQLLQNDIKNLRMRTRKLSPISCKKVAL